VSDTFPSPWSRSGLLFTRWPGPVTIRYRSVVCRASGINVFGPGVVVWRRWRAEDPDLAEEHGLPRETEETNPWAEMIEADMERSRLAEFITRLDLASGAAGGHLTGPLDIR
jgi:hypothetical protein